MHLSEERLISNELEDQMRRSGCWRHQRRYPDLKTILPEPDLRLGITAIGGAPTAARPPPSPPFVCDHSAVRRRFPWLWRGCCATTAPRCRYEQTGGRSHPSARVRRTRLATPAAASSRGGIVIGQTRLSCCLGTVQPDVHCPPGGGSSHKLKLLPSLDSATRR